MPTWLRALIVTPVVGALGLWFAYSVVRALRTGSINVRNDVVHRGRRPMYFWTAVLVQTAFAIVLFFSIARVFSS
jgi:hypothetical protein